MKWHTHYDPDMDAKHKAIQLQKTLEMQEAGTLQCLQLEVQDLGNGVEKYANGR